MLLVNETYDSFVDLATFMVPDLNFPILTLRGTTTDELHIPIYVTDQLSFIRAKRYILNYYTQCATILCKRINITLENILQKELIHNKEMNTYIVNDIHIYIYASRKPTIKLNLNELNFEKIFNALKAIFSIDKKNVWFGTFIKPYLEINDNKKYGKEFINVRESLKSLHYILRQLVDATTVD